MRRLSALAASLLVALGSTPAIAQQGAAQNVGSVTYLKTEPGSVLVERGSEIYQLTEGAAVFPGDRVFTRTNGALLFSINGCEVSLGGQQLIEVTDTVCTTAPTSLGYDAQIAGVTVGTGGGIAATPTILLGALGAGGVAAGVRSGRGRSDSAPPFASP